ncbi:F-box only protein 22 [Folsomia candida]|uniref:F-box only protein 22 n=1 Tax=Folsomia candida TaxID=158441 RepID=A0A226F488_FOLCA|nr:F-box only protein 22 [Folsomia candida]
MFENEMDQAGCPVFVQQYSIVKGILEKLTIRDLLSISKVCRTWSEVARVVRQQRKNAAQTFLWHPYGDHTSEVFEYYNGCSISDECQRFIDTAPDFGFPSVQELTQEQSWSPLFPQLRSAIIKDFNASFSEPQLMVVVATAAVDEYMPSDEDNITKLKIILSEIPRAIPCLVTISYGIVGSVKDKPISLEMENCEVPLVAGLRIPKVAGLFVKMFTVTKETNNKYKGKVDQENCQTILNIQPTDNVKAIVLFHTQVQKAGALKDAVFQYIKGHPHVALGGGAHYRNLASVCQGDFVPIGAGLIICGNDNVNVASVGLYDTKISKRNEEKLIEMKGCEFPDGDSFAFMFACNGRGANMHGGLIGTFTGGEYCHEVIPSRDVPAPPKFASSIEFAYTTVFVFVSYKYPTKHSVRS